MKKTSNNYLLLLVGLFFVFVWRKKKKKRFSETFQRINNEVLAKLKGYATPKEAIHHWPSPLPARKMATKREEYAYNKFKEYGFDDVKYLDFEVKALAPWQHSRGNRWRQCLLLPWALPWRPKLPAPGGYGQSAGGRLQQTQCRKDKLPLYIGLLDGSPDGLHNLHPARKPP